MSFIPFRLNRLAAAVSHHLAEIYRERFGLEIPEWRVLVTVGSQGPCTAQHIVHSTRTHKTRISRAISQLLKRGLIERIASVHDRREMELRFTSTGRRMYRQLVPIALKREHALLSCLSKQQLQDFVSALQQLEAALELSHTAENTDP